MGANNVFVVVHMPVGLRAALGEGRLRDLVAAHPRAKVNLAVGPDEVAALLPRADAALIVPSVAPVLAPAPQQKLSRISGTWPSTSGSKAQP